MPLLKKKRKPAGAYTFIIGPDPKHVERNDTKGNGSWITQADEPERALQVIFSSMPFPGEATGRFAYVEGVSRKCHASEVIQVWSDHPKATPVRLDKKDEWMLTLYGRGEESISLGLLSEIHVTGINQLVSPDLKALPLPGMESGSTAVLSPTGAAVHAMLDQRVKIQHAMSLRKLDLALRQSQMEEIATEMKEQMALADENLSMIHAYLNGGVSVTVLSNGDRAPGNDPYHVFQNRQFLDKELALLGNFLNFDFKELRQLDKWLMESGAIWKFLPFQKTVLATRLRREDKDYGDPLTNLLLSVYNRQNYVWVRDGEFVVRIAVDTDFDNAVFPATDQNEAVVSAVEDILWSEYYQPWEQRYGSSPIGRSSEPKPGLQKKAHALKEPYLPFVLERQYKTAVAWRGSSLYKKMAPFIREEVFEYLKAKNRKQMKFVLLLQGIVDRRGIFNIAPGTDLFEGTNTNKYFKLLYDYSHGIPDKRFREQFEFHRRVPRKGDWLIVDLERWSRYADENRRQSGIALVKVVSVVDGHFYFHYRPRRRKWPYGQAATPKKGKMKLEYWNYFHADVPPKLAARILDDREWKADPDHQWIVPLLAQWKFVLKNYLVSKQAGTLIHLPKGSPDEQ